MSLGHLLSGIWLCETQGAMWGTCCWLTSPGRCLNVFPTNLLAWLPPPVIQAARCEIKITSTMKQLFVALPVAGHLAQSCSPTFSANHWTFNKTVDYNDQFLFKDWEKQCII